MSMTSPVLTASTANSTSGATSGTRRPRPGPHRLLPQARGHRRLRCPRGACIDRAAAGAPVRGDGRTRRPRARGCRVAPDLPVGAPYRCASPYPATRPAGVSTATSPRTDACHRLPEPRRSRSRGRRLQLSRRDGRHAHALAKRHALGRRALTTYKHYMLSPDPKDHVGLDALREFTAA